MEKYVGVSFGDACFLYLGRVDGPSSIIPSVPDLYFLYSPSPPECLMFLSHLLPISFLSPWLRSVSQGHRRYKSLVACTMVKNHRLHSAACMIPIDNAFQFNFLRTGTRLKDKSGLAPHVKSTAPSTTITVLILIAGLALSVNQTLVLVWPSVLETWMGETVTSLEAYPRPTLVRELNGISAGWMCLVIVAPVDFMIRLLVLAL
ncbi:hypothetical protein F5144DRAFT_577910 [Chaetomium tenue]|uniref:Uncharacterized protein n=1 Tax=Chaetomium tenue TaxID=1854479 RepID=A0ACB7P2W2_9PEZI|nr:hypothetical protein F5144DRAFT_577910 [Chaetomium globosum]